MDPVLDAVARAAVTAGGATAGWVVVRDKDELRVAAAAGDGTAVLLGMVIAPDDGPSGFVIGSAQPVALARREAPDDADDIGARLGARPGTTLCVPCGDENEVFGALEVVDKAGGGTFTFDDVEIVTLLGTIAGAALAGGPTGADVVSPTELGADLERAALEDPRRYAALASAISALLGNG